MARPLVLVVEDDGATRGLLTLLPRSHGYEVRLTSTGREALQELGNRTPDVMILERNGRQPGEQDDGIAAAYETPTNPTHVYCEDDSLSRYPTPASVTSSLG